MKKHTTKRALLMSALSLLVCVSMLVGSTFAWFTDSVSSDRNIIQAGNLDVTLEYWDGDSYEEVTSSTKLFNDAALWEPGHAEVAYLRIDNAGSLALKYQLAVNVYNETSATNVAGETFKLSDHLVFSVVDKALTSRDDMFTREQAIAAAGNAMGLTSYNSGTVEMLPTDEPDCVALIIYMPTSVGNEANYRGAAPTIELGTTLVATQMASEQDSWNNSFDLPAPYPVLSLPAPMPETGAAAEDIVLNTEKGTETGIPAELVADIADQYPEAEELRLTHTEPVIDTTAKTVTFTHCDIVDEKGNVIDLEAMNNTTPVTVVISVGDAFAEGDVVVIYHDKEAVASAVVSADKTVTYTTTHFCEVVVSTGDGTIDSAAELNVALANGGMITLNDDLVLDSTMTIPTGANVVLDLNGKTITSTLAGKTAVIVVEGTAIIKNGTIVTGNGTGGILANGSAAALTVENLTVAAKGAREASDWNASALQLAYGAKLTVKSGNFSSEAGCGLIIKSSGGNATINGGTFTTSAQHPNAAIRADNWGYSATMTVNGGTFNGAFAGYFDGYKNVTINGGTFNGKLDSTYADIAINGGTFTESIFAMTGGHQNKYAITGGTFVDDPTKCVAAGYVVTENAGTWTVARAFVSDAASLETAIKAGGTIVLEDDIVMTKNLGVSNANFTLNGNGHTITLAEGVTNNIALLDIEDSTFTIKNVTFDGIKDGAVLRTVRSLAALDNVTVQNCVHTKEQGLFRMGDKSTFTNCTFKNNNCDMVITLNYDSNCTDYPQVVSNCLFEGNTCRNTAVLYYVYGASFLCDGNQFIGNTVNSTGNGATVYLGSKLDCTITNNIFKNNTVNSTGNTERVTGGLMVGNTAVVRNNAFIDNTVNAANATGNNVCANMKNNNIDLSGNYWGGNAPVEGDDYHIENANDQYQLTINDYLTSYEF